MPGGPLDQRLNQRVRQQLSELRIDPDAVLVRRPRASNRLKAWLGLHKQSVLMAGGAAACFALMLGIAALLTLPLMRSGGTSPQAGSASAGSSTSVSLDDMTVQLTNPSYQRFTYGQGVLILHIQVRNTVDMQTQLRAGDLLLVDGRGALFPPSWRDPGGAGGDGLADPRHVLIGLDPGAEAAIDVPFLTLGDGPFTLRYQRRGEQLEQPLPSLSLAARP